MKLKGEHARRVMLRAKLVVAGRTHVAHTIALSESWVLVRTDLEGTLGQRVSMTLSLPGLLDPINVEGEVARVHEGDEPGLPAGWTLKLSFGDEREQHAIQELLARVDAMPDGDVRPLRVLVVDDSELMLQIFNAWIRRYFRDRPVTFLLDTALDGEEAWQMLSSDSYDLAIIDYDLPRLGGDDLIQRVRTEPRLCETLVLAISVGGEQARQAMLAKGADLYFDKPVSVRDLFSTLERLTAARARPLASSGQP
jgi:CheY-like chemotaxis protein